MKYSMVLSGLVAAVVALPEPTQRAEVRQASGFLGGSIPGETGFLSGEVDSTATSGYAVVDGTTYTDLPSAIILERQFAIGSIGGVVGTQSGYLSGEAGASSATGFGVADGTTYTALPSAIILERQFAIGSIGGVVGTQSGYLSGEVGASSATGFAVVDGTTYTAVPTLDARQIAGSAGGSALGQSGYISGTIPASGVPYGCISGDGIELCGRATPAPEPIVERQVAGSAGGSALGQSGYISGTIPTSGLPYGCISGDGLELCGRATPMALVDRQIAGSAGGSALGQSGYISGTIPTSGLPYGCISGDGHEVCARETPAPVVEVRQIAGSAGGSALGQSGYISGTIPTSGLPYGCISGDGVEVCARATPAPEA